MATKYAIETVYKLIDNITMPLDKIGVKGKTVGRALKNEFTKTEQQLANVGTKLKSFAKGAALAGVALVGVGIGVATKQFIDYDAAVTGATAKFKDLDITSADYKDNLKAVGKVKVEGTVYPGTKIFVRDVLDEVKTEVTACTFFYENAFAKRGKYEPPLLDISKGPGDGYTTN